MAAHRFHLGASRSVSTSRVVPSVVPARLANTGTEISAFSTSPLALLLLRI